MAIDGIILRAFRNILKNKGWCRFESEIKRKNYGILGGGTADNGHNAGHQHFRGSDGYRNDGDVPFGSGYADFGNGFFPARR